MAGFDAWLLIQPTSYTQNIDGFEEREGLLGSSSEDARETGKNKSKLKVKEVKNVQLHGDIHRVHCTVCSAGYPCSPDFLDVLRTGTAPDCPECILRCALLCPSALAPPLIPPLVSADLRVARAARSIRVGTLRPSIVLYDEPHPYGDEIGSMCTTDLSKKPDVLIIMGTSLKVHGIKKLVKDFARAVHGHPAAGSPKNKTGGGKVIFVNKTAPGAEWNGIIDVHVAGDTDSWVDRVVRDWKKNRPADWETQPTLDTMLADDLFSVKKPHAKTSSTYSLCFCGGRLVVLIRGFVCRSAQGGRGERTAGHQPHIDRTTVPYQAPEGRRCRRGWWQPAQEALLQIGRGRHFSAQTSFALLCQVICRLHATLKPCSVSLSTTLSRSVHISSPCPTCSYSVPLPVFICTMRMLTSVLIDCV